MYKTFHIILGLLVLFLALSCNREGGELRVPISFSVGKYSAEVKADESEGIGIENFGVFANLPDTSPSKLLMENAKVKDKGSYWGTEESYYWPNGQGRMVDFYAYSPYSANPSDIGLDFSFDATTGMPSFEFTMSETADVDLMVAENEGCTAAGGPVSLTFKHLLCRVQFSFSVSDEGGFSYLVNMIKVNGTPRVATYDWVTDSFHVHETGSVEIHIQEDTDDHLIDSSTPMLIDAFTMYLMPGNLGEVEIQINNDPPKVLDMTEMELEEGMGMNVHFEVSLADISYTTAVTDWLEGGTASGDIS